MNHPMTDSGTLHEQAVALRRAGKSRREIKEALGLRGNRELGRLLGSEPPPDWTRRPKAKDELRERARELRGAGMDVRRDRRRARRGQELGVVVDPRRLHALEKRKQAIKAAHAARMSDARWAPIRRQRNIQRQQDKLAAAQEVGDLSERDVLTLGAMAYWCEGAKDKSYRRCESVNFINSDPALVSFFMYFLEVAGVTRDRIRPTVHIHETADLEGATRYWAGVLDLEVASFYKQVIKRHRPKTNRRNVGADYRGCVQITVLQSAQLYRRIEGWAFGAMLGEVRRKAFGPVAAAADEHELVERLRVCARGGQATPPNPVVSDP